MGSESHTRSQAPSANRQRLQRNKHIVNSADILFSVPILTSFQEGTSTMSEKRSSVLRYYTFVHATYARLSANRMSTVARRIRVFYYTPKPTIQTIPIALAAVDEY